MIAKWKISLLVGCVCLMSQGCTYRGWYEGLQERQRQDCYKYATEAEIQACLDRVDEKTYDQYEKQRKDAMRPSE